MKPRERMPTRAGGVATALIVSRRRAVRASGGVVDGVANLRGQDLDEPQGVELAVEIDEQDGRLASPERHAAAFPGHHRVHRGLHEDLRLAAAADAANLEQLAGPQRAVRVHEGNPRQHGICQYPGEQRRACAGRYAGRYARVSADGAGDARGSKL